MLNAFLKCMLVFGYGLISNRMHYRTCGWSSSASSFGLVAWLFVGWLLRYLLNRSDSPENILWVFDWRIKGLGPFFWELSGERAQGSHSVCIFFFFDLFWYGAPTYSCVCVFRSTGFSVLSGPKSKLPNMHLRIQLSLHFCKLYFSLSLQPHFQRYSPLLPVLGSFEEFSSVSVVDSRFSTLLLSSIRLLSFKIELLFSHLPRSCRIVP